MKKEIKSLNWVSIKDLINPVTVFSDTFNEASEEALFRLCISIRKKLKEEKINCSLSGMDFGSFECLFISVEEEYSSVAKEIVNGCSREAWKIWYNQKHCLRPEELQLDPVLG